MAIDSIELVKKVYPYSFIYNLKTGKVEKEEPVIDSVTYLKTGFVEIGDNQKHHLLMDRNQWNDFLKEIKSGGGAEQLAMIDGYLDEGTDQLVHAIEDGILKEMGEYALHEKRSKIDPSLRIAEEYKKRRKECKTYGHRDVAWVLEDLLGTCGYCSTSLRNYTKKLEIKTIDYPEEEIERIVL